MSFIITVYTNEGIIMASDSRLTYNMVNQGGISGTLIGVQTTDTTYKTFLCRDNSIGISTCGDASVRDMPIAGFIEDFISKKTNKDSTVESVSQGLIDHFSHFTPTPSTHFIVAGYNQSDLKQTITRVLIEERNYFFVDTSLPGAMWDGEIDIFTRLTKSVSLRNGNNSYTDLPSYVTGFNYFTLQDAINYAEYAVDVTIRTMFFQNRVKTVGGPIDILAIKPDGAFWIKRKQLHAKDYTPWRQSFVDSIQTFDDLDRLLLKAKEKSAVTVLSDSALQQRP